LSVQVLATTAEGTRCALASARQLTDGLPARRIVLLVPRLASYAAPVDAARDSRSALLEQHKAAAVAAGAEVTMLFCECRRAEDAVYQMLGASSLVIVGGRRSAWWPSREQRLAARLTAEGYPVVFAQVGAS
jgi:hypothetical protein